MAFAHLHVHTQYSILDGAARIKSLYSKKDKSKRLITGLIDRAKELEMPGIAITDHGNMYGVMEFYTEAKAKGITPIIGCELYIAPTDRKLKTKKDYSEEKTAMHLVLLAKDKEGYQNLIKLVSLGYTEGFYYRPRIDHSLIEKYNKGIICLSACMGGEIPLAIRSGNMEKAQKHADFYKSIFGKDFYIELQDHGMPEERALNTSLYKLAKKNNIGLVVTNDVHYVDKEDAKAHDTLLAIQTKTTLDSPKRYRFPADEFHLKTEEEMRKSFAKLGSAFENTVKISEECSELDIISKTYFMPDYPLEKGDDETSTLKKLCMKGLNVHYKNDIPKVAMDRLEMELDVISKMGFEGYFLIVQDFISYARNNSIAVGPGRGSAAGSIVSFATGITKVNPLDYNLLFERFLNPERKSMPDIDVDFQDDKRDDVIEYVKTKYGENNVAQIATFSSLSGKSVIKDVCRVMSIDYSIADRVSKLMSGTGTLFDMYNDPDLENFKREIDTTPQMKQVFELASKLEGLVRSVGLHAAGIVVSNKELFESVPIYQDSKTGVKASQYEMEHIEKAGLIKIDFLGIKNLRLIQDAIEDIKNRYDVFIDIDNLPLDDDKVYDIFRRADTGGIFQFESNGMRKMLMNIKPTSFEDLVSSVALYRPGPLKYGMDKQYADTKSKKIELEYMHPNLEPILRETQGVLIYQEQIMAISRILGGFTPAQADDLRKAMGKKNIETMDKLRGKFIEGGTANGYERKLLEDLYDLMSGFAEYGFNKSHSVCYALIAYQEAYIKAHYPMEYYVALLNTVMNDSDKIAIYLAEIKQSKIEIIMPSIFESNALFTQKDGKIIYGINAIKGIGLQVALAIEEDRMKNGAFKSLEDFAQRIDTQYMNKKVYEGLVKVGAMAGFNYSTGALLSGLETFMAYASNYKKEIASGQTMLFDNEIASSAGLGLNINNTAELDVSILREYEKETLGFACKFHPFVKYITEIDYKFYNNTTDIEEDVESKEIMILPCVVVSARETSTKRNVPMVVLTVADFYSETTFFIKTVKTIDKFMALCFVDNPILIKFKRERSRFDSRVYNTIIDIELLDDVLKNNLNVKLKEIKREIVIETNAVNNIPKNEIINSAPKVEPKKLQSTANATQNKFYPSSKPANSAHSIELLVDKRLFDEMDLHCLRSSIRNHPGNCPVYLHLKDDKILKKMAIGSEFRVSASEHFMADTRESIRSLISINIV